MEERNEKEGKREMMRKSKREKDDVVYTDRDRRDTDKSSTAVGE